MRNITHFVSSRLQQMPYGLRVVSKVLLIFAFVFPIFTLILLLAHGQHSHFVINGKQVTYEEFLHRGGFLQFFLIGIYSAILVYGFLHASRWSRPLCFLPFAISLFLAVFHSSQAPLATALYGYLSLICSAALLSWYLFYRQTVRDYYARTQKPAA